MGTLHWLPLEGRRPMPHWLPCPQRLGLAGATGAEVAAHLSLGGAALCACRLSVVGERAGPWLC